MDLTPEFTAAYHHPEDAQVQPVAAAYGLLHGALRRGSTLRAGVAVTGPVLTNGTLTGVQTNSGTIAAAPSA
jgi:glycine/D-amino acid oxidase-like deaminating enzyme